MSKNPSRKLVLALLALAVLAIPALPAHATTVIVVNIDGPNEGFNDPTPVAPVGGNTGTTRGQQRLIAVQFAADIWGTILDSAAPIIIRAQFSPQACTATAAVLASAGARQVFANSVNVEIPEIWYHVALANKLAGADLSPGAPGTGGDDINATFNSDVDNPVCLGAVSFYYGLDNLHGTDTDLVSTALHEVGHGLGFANFVNELDGSLFSGRGDIFAEYTKDVSTGKGWNTMTNAERAASALNTNKVAWSGIHSTAGGASFLAPGTPGVKITSPAALGTLRVGTASFGNPLSSPGVSGRVVLAFDADEDGAVAAFTTTDGCSPITNSIAGKIALVDRGGCGFVVKAKTVQNAGAIAMIVADNAAGSPPIGMSGVDTTVFIPSARITLLNGNQVKAALGGIVNATVGIDMAVRQGTEATSGMVLLNAPDPVSTGSSISHWDPIAFPSLLMEPSINGDLTHTGDLTIEHFTDIGWFSDFDGVPDGRDSCVGSDQSATVVIDGCNSGVTNTVFTNGCRISDGIEDCAVGATNHGKFVSCVSHYTNDLKKDGVISGSQKGAIQSCAGQANIP